MIDFDEVERGDSVVLDVDWDDGTRESIDVDFLALERNSVVVRDDEGDRYSFRIDREYGEKTLRVWGYCDNCGQEYWARCGAVYDVEVPTYVPEEQLTLGEIAD